MNPAMIAQTSPVTKEGNISVLLSSRCVAIRCLLMNLQVESSCYKHVVLYVVWDPYIVASNLKILIPVGTALISVADVKYPRVSPPIPTVNIWCACTTNPSTPIAGMADIFLGFPNAYFFPLA